MEMRKLFGSAVTPLLVLAAAVVSLPQQARADFQLPPIPIEVQVDAGNEVFLVGHAVGYQNYVCVPAGAGAAWSLFTPQATLFDDHSKQLITHFFSPNPFEDGKVRATWESSRDKSDRSHVVL